MRFFIVLCFIFILACFIPNVLVYADHSSPLYKLLRKNPWQSKINYSILPIGKNNDHFNEEIHSDDYEDTISIRNVWDSGEDSYFQWANQHRRPVEYLTGRKRDTSKIASPTRDRRINGGLWRSGLVG